MIGQKGFFTWDRIGESAGAYRITAIGVRSVTLQGPGGTRVLTMGQ